MQNNRGFTLIELMVTIAVLAIIAMIAAPSFIKTVRTNQLVSDTRDFVNLLAETRSEAILKMNNKVLAVNFTIADSYKTWTPSQKVTKESGDNSVTFNRLGQLTITTSGQCFVFKNNMDTALKSYVYIEKGGTVLYNKSATSCPIG